MQDMFFFFHLVAGIVLGLLIAELLDDRRWVIPCALGAVLPDLIDKPLGYLIIPSIGYGRVFFHNLWIFVILLVVGIIAWKFYGNPVVIALDTGILSHQILDSMWTDLATWLYPALGTTSVHTPAPPDFIVYLLETDLFNPAEWILVALCIAGAVLYWKRKTVLDRAKHHIRATGLVLRCTEIILGILCGAVVLCYLFKIPLTNLAVKSVDQYGMVAAILILAAILLYLWELRLYGHRPVRSRQIVPARMKSLPPPGPLSRNLVRMDCLVRALGADPAWVSFASAAETAAAHGITSTLQEDQIIFTLARIRILLGIIILTAAGGAIILLASGREIPDGLLVLGFAAAGLFVGYLIGSIE